MQGILQERHDIVLDALFNEWLDILTPTSHYRVALRQCHSPSSGGAAWPSPGEPISMGNEELPLGTNQSLRSSNLPRLRGSLIIVLNALSRSS